MSTIIYYFLFLVYFFSIHPKALKLDVTNVDENIIEETFTDCYLVKPENRKYIAKAIEKGLVVGYEGRLSPKNRLTRAETVTLLARAEKL